MKRINFFIIFLLAVLFFSACTEQVVIETYPGGYELREPAGPDDLEYQTELYDSTGMHLFSIPSYHKKAGLKKINEHLYYVAISDYQAEEYKEADNVMIINGHIDVIKFVKKLNPNAFLVKIGEKYSTIDSLGQKSTFIWEDFHVIDSNYALIKKDTNEKLFTILNINTLQEGALLSMDSLDRIVAKEGFFASDSAGLYAYFHVKKGQMTDYIFSSAMPFSDGLALVDVANDMKGYGYIDTTFQVVIKTGFLDKFFARVVDQVWLETSQIMRTEDYSMLNFRNGFARYFVTINEQKLWGYVDHTGKVRLKHHYSELPYWKKDGVLAEDKNGLPVKIEHLKK